MPDLLKNGSLLSHFVHENLIFDTIIKEQYLYVPSGKDKWDGLIQYSLKSQRTFATWRDTEKNCMPFLNYKILTKVAESRYNDILSAKDASEVEYEGVDALDVKPTKGAMRVMDLLETFTGLTPNSPAHVDRFRGLAIFEHRLQFVVEVQISILDLNHGKWKANVEKFEISHPYALAVNATNSRDFVAQAGERMCFVGSADQ